MPQGRSPTNEEIRPWRSASSKVLSQGTIMKLQLPLMVEQFSETIRKYARIIHIVLGRLAPILHVLDVARDLHVCNL